MRLLIHGGLHKTASTFLQQLLLINRAALRARRVYVQPDTHLLANHGTAWMALQRDYRHAAAHVREAIKAGCSVMILTSEDFEGLIFNLERLAALESAVRSAGVTELEWHFCLRDPGEYLASMYAELSKHQYVDFLAMSVIALRDGKVRVERPAKRLPRKWQFCFDHARFLEPFAEATGGTLHLHDFRDGTPFPGHRIVSGLAGSDFTPELPGNGARNQRPDEAQVEANLAAQLEQITEGAGLPEQVRAVLLEHTTVSQEVQDACAAAVSRRFAPGMESLLSRWSASRAA